MTAAPAAETRPLTPFERIGGGAVVQRIVERFYDLMEEEPAYAPLRAMHAPDLAPMRRSLAGFLAGWLGGPRDWFEAHPGLCMMSMHRRMDITSETASQWVHAMGRAVTDAGVEAAMGRQMIRAFTGMAAAMIRRPEA